MERFRKNRTALAEMHSRKRQLRRVPVKIPEGRKLLLSPGKHNEVQKAVVEEFAPRFAPGAHLLYLGDTEKKDLWLDQNALSRMRIGVTAHDKLPDLILHDEEREWLFFIEAVTSHGPVTPKRLIELTKMAAGAEVGLVFVTAFPNLAEFRKHIDAIAWETEVWMADRPDHLIHSGPS